MDANRQEMMEALVSLRDAARNFCHQILNSRHNDIMDKYTCREKGFPAVLALRDAIPRANAAIAAPPRQCDVGTAEEQTARYYEFCKKQNHETCNTCPLHSSCVKCEMAWAQMPYEAQEGARE